MLLLQYNLEDTNTAPFVLKWILSHFLQDQVAKCRVMENRCFHKFVSTENEFEIGFASAACNVGLHTQQILPLTSPVQEGVSSLSSCGAIVRPLPCTAEVRNFTPAPCSAAVSVVLPSPYSAGISVLTPSPCSAGVSNLAPPMGDWIMHEALNPFLLVNLAAQRTNCYSSPQLQHTSFISLTSKGNSAADRCFCLGFPLSSMRRLNKRLSLYWLGNLRSQRIAQCMC